MDELLVGTITLSSILTGNDDLVKVETDGELSLVQMLGMLEMAKDTLLHGDNDA